MYRPLFAMLAISLLSSPTTMTVADTLEVPEVKEETFSVTLPGRGMTMQQVMDRFGEPQEKQAAVGTPPISTWIYPKFTVYFESHYVIHAVFHKPE